MRAYRIVEWERPPELVDAPMPEAGPGQVVVKVAGNGLCHSDGMMSQMPAAIGDMLGWQVPFTLGHEIAGHVHQVGDGVTGIAPGDPVALVSPTSCGTCRYCVRGQDSACPNGLAGRGYGRDGGLADYVLVESTRSLLALGDLDPLRAAPLTDAGATAYHAVRRVIPRLAPGSTAVVIGAGGLGSFAVQFLRVLTPATVVAVDTNEARHDVAADFGAHDVRTELTGSAVADVVLDFVGVDATVRAGATATRPYGAFGVIGAAGGTFKGPWYGGLPRDADVFTFQGSCISDAQEVLALAREGLIRSEFDLYPLDRIAEAYEALEQGRLRGRAVVTP